MHHTLRVATYNIHKCRGLDGRVRPSRIVEVLREVSADIIALQEVLRVADSGGQDHALSIASALGMHFCFGENRRLNGGRYGNVLLSRFPVRFVHNYDLTSCNREARGCLRADIDLGQSTVHCFNVHLGTSFRERRQQARMLVSPEILLNSALQGPRIVLGDFNEWTRGLVSHLLATHLGSIDIRQYLGRSRTYPGIVPLLHLDHIYCDASLVLQHLTLHRTRISMIASDHLPLVAEFRLNLARSCQEVALGAN